VKITSPLLTGDTLQYFHADGINQASRDLLKIKANGSAISQATAFKKKAEIPSESV